MILNSIAAASLFAIVAAISVNASAASDTPANTGAALGRPADTEAEKAAPKKMLKRHSHVEDKTGFAPKAPETVPAKQSAAKDRTKHFHPRDGK